jgi:2-polyprenyl-3-methyl-5-hydroxy-6-metoxy-1,4-benzoquinol methylase
MAFEELKQRQSAVWGSAPFENVAELIANIHDHLVAELAPQPGERWLDVATGTGGVAVRAARAGAKVTGSDLSPALIETAKRLAADEGLEIEGLHDAYVDHMEQHRKNGRIEAPREYLIILGTRR